MRTPSQAKGPSSRRAVIFLLLFLLPFAGGGTFVAYLAGSMVTTWVRAQSWQEVPARILSLDLDSSTSDGSTTYRLEATYEYAFGERLYPDLCPGNWTADSENFSIRKRGGRFS